MTSNEGPTAGTPPGLRPSGGEAGSVHVLFLERVTRTVLSGEIDAELSGDLLEAAGSALAAGLPIEVDTQHVTFMDSAGVAFLARLASKSRPGRVRVLRPPAMVRFLLDVTDIARVVDVVEVVPPAGGDEPSPPAGPADQRRR